MKWSWAFLLIAICAALTFAATPLGAAPTSHANPLTARVDLSLTEQVRPENSAGNSNVSTPSLSSPGNSASGALFINDDHSCSASVVHSPAGNLVLTAAHCVHEGANGTVRRGLSFVPGYHSGTAPYGKWAITQVMVPPGWATKSDPDLDFAFLTVRQVGNLNSLESLTGANQLGIDHGFENVVTLTGYPDTADTAVSCQNISSQQSAHQMRVACSGFPDGTSGGSWVTDIDPKTALGTVIGVVGGYQLGGNDPDISYSSYFDATIKELYLLSTTKNTTMNSTV